MRLNYAILIGVFPIFVFGVNLKKVEFEGLIHISPIVAQEMIGVKIGEPIDIKKIDDSIYRFYEQGYFKDIYVTEDGGVLTYHFVEKPIIANIDLNGYGNNKESEELNRELGLKKGDVYDVGKVEETKRRIVSLLESRGYYDTVVEATTEEINQNSINLIFDINQGENITIREIKYCGAEEFDGGDFESGTSNRERDFIGWMWGFNSGELKVNDLEYDSARIRDYYMTKGFLDAQVSSPYLSANFNTYDATIEYKISEGKAYEVDKIGFFLDKDVLSEDVLRSSLKSIEGRRFDVSRVRKDMEAIKEKIANLGYAFVRIAPDFNKRSDEGKVDITYSVVVGEKVKINDVLISGNTRTLDRVIRRDIFLAPGDEYSYTDLKDSVNALKRSGYFENVEIEERRVSENLIDLLVVVKEAKTGEFKFGIGYGSYGGLSGMVGLSDKNVFGSGMSASGTIDTSTKEQKYKFSIYNPRVYDSEYSLSTEIYKMEFEAYDYTEKKNGFGVTLGKNLSRHLKASLGYEITQTTLTGYVDTLEEEYKKYYDDGEFIKSSITPGLSFDNTNDYLLPSEGIIASTYIEYAGVGGDEKYIKNRSSFSTYKGLEDYIDQDIILRYKGRFGYLIDNGYLPINEKFYLGGISTIRGYKSGSISPMDQNGIRTGGKMVFSNSVEASYGLFDTVQMRLTLFYDFGMVGEDDFAEISRSSVGAAIEWISPVGPLHLIFPKALDDKKGDKVSSFEFSMGQRF